MKLFHLYVFQTFLFDQEPTEIRNEKGQCNFVIKQLVVILKKMP